MIAQRRLRIGPKSTHRLNFFFKPALGAGLPALEGAARSRVPARLRGRPRRRVPLASGTTGPFLPRFCRINGSTISPQSTQTNASNVYPLLSRRSMAQSHPPHRWHFMSLTRPVNAAATLFAPPTLQADQEQEKKYIGSVPKGKTLGNQGIP